MRHRCLVTVLTVIAVVSLMPVTTSGQAAPTPPRTTWGDPDL